MRAAPGYRTLLALPAPRWLALASLPADFADWLDYAAVVALLVFTWQQGPLALALFALCLALPYLTAGPVLAIYVDRLPLRRVLFWSNLARALATSALLIAPNTAVVLLLVFVRGCIDSAFNPARQSAIQASTPADLLPHANALHHAINQGSKILGPALGGLLLTALSPQGVFAVNAGFSLLAALLVLPLQLASRQPTTTPERFSVALLAGVSEFGRSRLLLTALVFSAIAFFAFFLYDTFIALLLDDLGYGPSALGFSLACSGLGGLLGAVLAARMPPENPLASMISGALIAGLAVGALGLGAALELGLPLPAYLALMAVMGGSTAFMLVPYRTIIQTETPPDRIARVSAAGEAVTTAIMLSGPFVGSFIATLWGNAAAFIAGACVLLLLAFAGLVILALRPRP
ncbi:MFS transporter [Devosia sp. 1566]|uniref:MFS transporter n=1 Tax=Devosia sp. 1566 TaxID=2499144 RepID=UPI000FD6E42F|nr:MFS transporter [Devosia sp. 1566]